MYISQYLWDGYLSSCSVRGWFSLFYIPYIVCFLSAKFYTLYENCLLSLSFSTKWSLCLLLLSFWCRSRQASGIIEGSKWMCAWGMNEREEKEDKITAPWVSVVVLEVQICRRAGREERRRLDELWCSLMESSPGSRRSQILTIPKYPLPRPLTALYVIVIW